MRSVSEIIERYLKHILMQSPSGIIEIQRNELADQFNCVPSQINYVISTRFTLEKGYIVESKRGGGGYIRIQKVRLRSDEAILDHVLRKIGAEIDQPASEGIIYQLRDGGHISEREAKMLQAAMSRETLQLALPVRDQVRAKLLKAMLLSLLGSWNGPNNRKEG